jgi:acetolactate synthase-1/2/3 large subunit
MVQSSTAIQVLLHALEEEGVSHIFGVPGGPLVPLYEGLAERQSIQHILAKHEEGAAFMAEGYARVHRGLGVCCATSGPGATNAITGIASANSDSIPVLCLTAQVATHAFGKGAVQDSSGGNRCVNVVDMYRSATKLSVMLDNAQQMPHMVRHAIRTALTGRPGAVHLNLPADVVKHPVPLASAATGRYYTQSVPAGDRHAIQNVARALHGARRPVILAGHGVNISGAWSPLQRIAEMANIPIATTLKGKGAFSERHALSLGVFGFGGHPLAEEYLLSDEIDLLLVIGSSLGEFQTNSWDPRLSYQRTMIQIDIDPLEIGKNYPIDMSIIGDASSVLEALAYELVTFPGKIHNQTTSALAQAREKISRFYHAEELQEQAQVLKPQALVAKMNEILPEETLLFVDIGNCISWIGQYYEAKQAGSVFMAINLAPMGYAIAASIGAKIAAPDKPVVAFVGDGAFAMNGMELHTAAEYHVPVIWVVLNNGGHGMVHNGETLLTGRSLASVFRVPLDVSAIARSLGIQAFKATSLAEFSDSLTYALALQEPCVIDAIVDIKEIPSALLRRVNTLNAFFGQENQENHKDPVAAQAD